MSNRLPNDLMNRLKDDPHFSYEAFIARHDVEQKTASIRINPYRAFDRSLLHLDKEIPWVKNGYYLKEKPAFANDPLFHAGCYSVQGASYMFLDEVIRQLQLDREGVKALDLHAARGGQSTLLNSALHTDSLLVANESLKSRRTALKDNLMRWGSPNVVVTNNDPSAFGRLPGYFDFIVVDAPSSAMLHKSSLEDHEWALANAKLNSERQRSILNDSLSSLKEGGYLFYSTYSYFKEENEAIVDWIIDEMGFESVHVEVNPNWNIERVLSDNYQAVGYRFDRNQEVEGTFFCTVLRKKVEQKSFSMKSVKMEKNTTPQALANDWLDTAGLYSFIDHDFLHVFPKKYEQDLTALQNVLNLHHAGTQLGKYTGSGLIPSHDLALSNRIRKDISCLALTLEQAQSYLRKEECSVEINPLGLRGWVLVQYEGVNLGWIKIMPNRINNYYPKEMRLVEL